MPDRHRLSYRAIARSGLVVGAAVFVSVLIWAENKYSDDFHDCVGEVSRYQSADNPDKGRFVIGRATARQIVCSIDFVDRHNGFVAALAGVAVAAFTLTLKQIGRKQWEDIRITQRASLGVEPCGVSSYMPRENDGCDPTKDNIVGHFGVRNTGHLPARDVRWCFDAAFDDDEHRGDFDLKGRKWYGENNVLPPGAIMRQGGEALPLPKDERKKYFYVWGRVEYEDGFGKPRWTNFCHRYNLARITNRSRDPRDTEQRMGEKYGRYYERGNDAE